MSRSKFYSAMVIGLTIALMSISSLSSATAAPGVNKYGPFDSGSTDSGTCGNDWANDTFNRYFKVFNTKNADGTYTVTEDFREGSFVTIAGPSPQACDHDSPTGGNVAAGVTGKVSGKFNIIVYSGDFKPAAEIKDIDGDGKIGTADFIHSVFGAGATYDVLHYSFQYSTKNNGSWINSDAGNSGDITGN